MAWALFSGRALLARSSERRLDTERELRAALDNRLLLLLFAARRCPRCREFEPRLRRFWSRLTDPAHVERPEQLGLVYVGRDPSEEEHRRYLREKPRSWMALPYRDVAFAGRLTDPAHVERPEQLGLVYVGRDPSEEEHRRYLRDMPRSWMALPYRDAAFGR
ncbi:nucleoredoxin-like protein 1 [Passer montanus]|uniref:nucleoredoxin-like protein 1 n=1 Tax=Passer montanus TaxID=9160 RepID=UPI0019619C8D|nr:nucleoredoxin-like protein 1 [Passer montanus]